MNTAELRTNSSMDDAIASEFTDELPEGEVIRITPEAELVEAEPELEFVGGVAFLKNGATLPTHVCVKTGRRANKLVEKPLRNPFNPKTWFGKRQTLQIGLTKKQYENHMVANAVTWSGVGVGALVFVSGIVSLSILSIVAGVLIGFGMSLGRAFFPVWAKPGDTENEIEVHGLSPAYLKAIGA